MTSDSDVANDASTTVQPPQPVDYGVVVGEPRWPMAGAVVAAMVLTSETTPARRWMPASAGSPRTAQR